jgi:hypothetical protein
VVVGRIIVDVRNSSGKTERRECHEIVSKGISNAFLRIFREILEKGDRFT